jgi:hypothetical protein
MFNNPEEGTIWVRKILELKFYLHQLQPLRIMALEFIIVR